MNSLKTETFNRLKLRTALRTAIFCDNDRVPLMCLRYGDNFPLF